MTVALVLDEVTLPQAGAIELHLNYTFDLNITAAEARQRVHAWLVDHVSYMICAGEPTLVLRSMESSEGSARWRVPAILTATHLGDVGIVGSVDVDVASGEMGDLAHSREKILEGAQRLAATMPPYTPRKELPTAYLVTDVQPTITRPLGQPFTIPSATP
jgi:hypothetical protein